MHADAPPAYSRMAFQSAEIAMVQCDAGKFLLALPEGPVTKGRNAPKTVLAQGAEVGCRPCCARATRYAYPPMC